MKLASPIDMRKLDQIAMDKYNIPGILLMENAALNVAGKAKEMLGNTYRDRKTLVVAGKGNNGGDGFATARHLIQWGYSVITICLCERSQVTGEPELYLKILEKLNAPVMFVYDEADLIEISRIFNEAYLIIDGIFGTGFHGSVEGLYESVIQAVNKSNARVLSIDIPSGINGDSGQVTGIAVKADETVTFTLPKPGLMQFPGAEYAGRVTVADIGIPAEAIEQLSLDGQVTDSDVIADYIPIRPKDANKGVFGKILIVTGSRGMTGAGILSAEAAFRTGSGLVYLAVPESLTGIYGTAICEAITIPLKDKDGCIMPENTDELTKRAELMDTVVIGPGLSTNAGVAELVKKFIVRCGKPMVIDADALNIISDDPQILKKRPAPTVITPHPGEFSRLTKMTVEEIRKNRVKAALEYSREWNVTVVLKGAGTVTANPKGEYFINTSGNPGLAVAGSGDVLAGITGSLIGQGVKPDMAAVLGVYMHGKCGDLLSDKYKRQGGFTAGEICAAIPYVTGELAAKGRKES